ncbi:hypothetical protein LBMAG42_17920 [Deltaproteobacteria bacterium]|nr:hypothetical protein LBMAG42_17920 [Deltaproteobacteria bacterium]
MSLGILLSLAACTGTTGGAVDSASVADYTLNLRPIVPLDLNPFDGADRIDLLLDSGVGDPVRITLDAPAAGDSALAEGLPALDGTRIIVEGYSGGELVAWGRSAPVIAVNGEVEATIFVSGPEAIGKLGGLPEPDADGAGAALGDGRFVVMGGSGNRTSGNVDKTTDAMWVLDLEEPEEGLAFTEIGAMPSYVDAKGDEQSKRRGFTLTRLTAGDAGKFLMVGGGPSYGYGDSTELTAEARLFDPETLNFEDAIPDKDALSNARSSHRAIGNQQGAVLVWGGFGSTPDAGQFILLADGELYDPAQRSFSSIIGVDDGGSVGVVLADLGDDGTLVAGGARMEGNNWAISDASLAVSLRGDVDELSGMDPMAGGAAVTLADGDVVVFGGVSSNASFAQDAAAVATDQVWRFRHGSNTWEEVGKLEVERAGHTATAIDDTHVLIAGGSTTWSPFAFGATALSCVEIYDVATDTSSMLERCDEQDDAVGLPGRAEAPLALDDPDLGIVFVGGVDGENGAVATTSFYGRAPD